MTESGNTPTGGERRTGVGVKLSIAALALAGAAVLWVGLTVQREPGARAVRAAESGLRGSVLPEPAPKPPFTLTDLDGRPYDFAAETQGRLTLLFFGFTHCPDICPVHLANVAAVLRDQRPEVRRQVSVVFVTADPERDTPERLREWLAAFDPSFVGLRGSLDEVNAVLSELRLAPAVHGPRDERGDYSVGHPAQILAFTPDGYLRAMYPFGTRQADWAHDLPRLAGFTASADAPAAVALLRGSQAYVPAPAGDGPAALYVTVANRAKTPDTLVGGATSAASSVEVHGHTQRDGAMMMERVTGAPVAAGDSLSLRPGGYHLMLHGLTRRAPGDTFTVQLHFRNAGTLPVKAVVVPYAALERMLGPAGHAEH
jgi:cytochrome oxidase Cu insertion factor (SCO1/SenC/PrrC family)/copper(I)-binding protein